jgi:uncharacterized protein YndB with AHSA1/START domain
MPRVEASRELPASRDEVWRTVSDPDRLREWWPGIGDVQPDRRGFAPGARWRLVGDEQPRFVRRPNMAGTLVVLAVEPPARLSFVVTGDGVQADLRLEETSPARTLATLSVEGPPLIGLRRGMPQRALARLAAHF